MPFYYPPNLFYYFYPVFNPILVLIYISDRRSLEPIAVVTHNKRIFKKGPSLPDREKRGADPSDPNHLKDYGNQ